MKRKLFVVIGILAMLLGLTPSYYFAAAPVSLLENCTPAIGVVIQPPYSSGYVACASGVLTGIPAGIGAITFKHDDPDTLLVATYTETSPGGIYSVPIQRDADNHIIDVVNPGTSFASAPYVSTGMVYGPENILFYSRSPVNELGEIKPGSVGTDRVIDLSALGVTPSVSGMNFVPSGFPHAGELKLVTNRTGEWYAVTLSPDGDGAYSIATITKKTQISSYPEGFVYVPPASNPFPDYSAMLVGEYYKGAISAYLLDAESNPLPDSGTTFLTGLPYVQGSAIDPVTGDLIVATRSGRLTSVRGFGTQPWVPTPTPTATTIPPGTNVISGTMKDNYGNPLSDVYISVDGVFASRSSGGYYFVTGLTAGTYTITAELWPYTFTPSQATVTVPPDATLNFIARREVFHPPVILVHGYLGMAGITDKCEYGVKHRNEETMMDALFDDVATWLGYDGFDVWVAHWDSAPFPDITTPLEVSAQCLADQIAEVKQRTGQDKVILIAHSMGGLVSRAYLQTSTYAVRQDVENLITLGSPHGGFIGLSVLGSILPAPLAIYCIAQPAFCQLDPSYMRLFNIRSERNTVDYTFIVGDGGGGPLGGVLWLLSGPNDGACGTASGTGKYFSWLGNTSALRHPLTRYLTHEDHIREIGNWYFEPLPGKPWSESYNCVREILLGSDRVDCRAAPAPPARAQEQGTSFALAPKQSGHISTGETISRTLSIDTAERSIFALTWMTQTLSLTLIDPDGVTIDPNYALSNPSLVTFDSGPASNGSPGWMTYAFTNTVPGDWTLGISALEVGQDGTDWAVIAGFASDRSLEVGIGTGFYQIGDTATLTATLNSGTAGIAGATVSVDLARPDSVIDTLTLTDMGGGYYQGTYSIPNAPGYVDVIFTATGNDGGTAFSRQSSQLLSIMPNTGQLTSSYADRAVDEDGDKSADALEVDVDIDISKAGDYNLSADLHADGQVVAQSSKVFSATAGVQTVTLRFDGSDIFNAGLDGPYLLTNLVLVDLQSAVPTIMRSDLYTTAAYKYAQFMPVRSIYLPMINR